MITTNSYQNLLLGAIMLMRLTVYSQSDHAKKNETTAYRAVNRTLTLLENENVVHLDEKAGAGIAWLDDKIFENGTIEFQVKGKNVLQKSFVGLAFHGLNDSCYEAIYFRPFNFQSEDAVRRSHGVQYIALPGYDWPKLREEFPNKYEQEVSPAPNPNDWFHVRIVVNGKKISAFVNGNSKATLIVESLVNPKGHQVGFWVGNGSEGDWKDLKISPSVR